MRLWSSCPGRFCRNSATITGRATCLLGARIVVLVRSDKGREGACLLPPARRKENRRAQQEGSIILSEVAYQCCVPVQRQVRVTSTTDETTAWDGTLGKRAVLCCTRPTRRLVASSIGGDVSSFPENPTPFRHNTTCDTYWRY